MIFEVGKDSLAVQHGGGSGAPFERITYTLS